MTDNDYRDGVHEFNRATRAVLPTAIMWIFGILVLSLVLGGIAFGIRWVTAEPKGRLDAREQILSGSNRIVQYDHFFDLCASIQTNEAQIDALLDEKATASATRLDTINASITGVSAARLGAIAQYNADASRTTRTDSSGTRTSRTKSRPPFTNKETVRNAPQTDPDPAAHPRVSSVDGFGLLLGRRTNIR